MRAEVNTNDDSLTIVRRGQTVQRPPRLTDAEIHRIRARHCAHG